MNSRIYICRHGQTVWNVEERKQGHLDSPLTYEGVKQARSLAAYLRRDGVKGTIYSSPLGRAFRSASIVQEQNENLELKIDERLKEISFGILESLTKEEIEKKHKAIYEGFCIDPFNCPLPMGESYNHLYQRASSFLKEMIGDDEHRDIVIIAHEDINKMLTVTLLGLDIRECMKIEQPHDIVYKIRRSPLALFPEQINQPH